MLIDFYFLFRNNPLRYSNWDQTQQINDQKHKFLIIFIVYPMFCLDYNWVYIMFTELSRAVIIFYYKSVDKMRFLLNKWIESYI
jgi:hypothetical protein